LLGDVVVTKVVTPIDVEDFQGVEMGKCALEQLGVFWVELELSDQQGEIRWVGEGAEEAGNVVGANLDLGVERLRGDDVQLLGCETHAVECSSIHADILDDLEEKLVGDIFDGLHGDAVLVRYVSRSIEYCAGGWEGR